MVEMGSALEQSAMKQGALCLEDSPRNRRRTPVRIRRVFSLGFERRPESPCPFHLVFYHLRDLVNLALMDFKQKLVVDLKNHAGFKPIYLVMDSDHRYLYYIGCRTLNGRIYCSALPKCSCCSVIRFEFLNRAAPS